MAFGGNARGDEALETAPSLVEHTERGVPGAGQLTRFVQDPLEDRLGLQLGYELAADLQQPAAVGFVAARRHGSQHSPGRTVRRAPALGS